MQRRTSRAVIVGIILVAFAATPTFGSSPPAQASDLARLAAVQDDEKGTTIPADAKDKGNATRLAAASIEQKCTLWILKNVCLPVAETIMEQECEYVLKQVTQPAPPPPSTTQPKPLAPSAKPIMIKVKVCKQVPKKVTKQKCTQKRECQKYGK